jgi:hypothetical protein
MNIEPIPPSSDPHSVGNRQLAHAIRGVNSICFFKIMLRQAAEQFAAVDEAGNHDDVLPDQILGRAGESQLDHSHSALCIAVCEYRTSLAHLRQAHRSVAGLFKGELKDDTEEALARAVTAASGGLAKLEQAYSSYELPKRPHEIRRNTLSVLIVNCAEVSGHVLTLFTDHCNDASPDLVAVLTQSYADLKALTERLKKLRERCSQKMSENISECRDTMDAIAQRIDDAGFEASKRAGSVRWYNGWRQRAEAETAAA